MKKFRSQMTKVLLGIGVFLLCFCAAFSVKADAAQTVSQISSPTIKLNMSTIRLKKRQSTTQFKVSGLAAGDYVTGYSSSNKKIFTVNNYGKITAKKKKGSATLSVYLASGLVGKAKVIVQNGPVKTTKVSVNTYNLKLAKGQSYRLTASKYPLTSKYGIKFSSSNKKIATVSRNGTVVAKKKGSCKIYVKSGNKRRTVKVSVLANSVPIGDGNLFLSVCRNISNQILADGNWIYSNSGTKKTYKESRDASRRATNCAHFVSICAQEFGGLNKGQTFYGNMDGEIKASSSTMAVLKTNYEIINVNKQPFPTVQYMLQPGDICIWVGQHTNIYAGTDASGNLCWFDAGGNMTADGRHDSGPFSRLYKTSSYKNGRLSYILRVKNKMAN